MADTKGEWKVPDDEEIDPDAFKNDSGKADDSWDEPLDPKAHSEFSTQKRAENLWNESPKPNLENPKDKAKESVHSTLRTDPQNNGWDKPKVTIHSLPENVIKFEKGTSECVKKDDCIEDENNIKHALSESKTLDKKLDTLTTSKEDAHTTSESVLNNIHNEEKKPIVEKNQAVSISDESNQFTTQNKDVKKVQEELDEAENNKESKAPLNKIPNAKSSSIDPKEELKGSPDMVSSIKLNEQQNVPSGLDNQKGVSNSSAQKDALNFNDNKEPTRNFYRNVQQPIESTNFRSSRGNYRETNNERYIQNKSSNESNNSRGEWRGRYRNRGRRYRGTYGDPFKELKEKFANDFPLLDSIEVSKFTYQVKGVISKYQYTVLTNLGYAAEVIRKFHSKEVFEMLRPTQSFCDFELAIHAEYLSNYKIEECKGRCKNKVVCMRFHSAKERRRRVRFYGTGAWNYYPEMCKMKGKCTNEECRYTHTQFEIDYHPLKYKGMMCEHESDGFNCINLGSRCFNAHNEEDLRDIKMICTQLYSNTTMNTEDISYKTSEDTTILTLDEYEYANFDIINYKTEKCQGDCCEGYFNCIYYHSILERRRNTKEFSYRAKMCKNTYVNGKYIDPINCGNKDKCLYCHTKNEYYYHPNNFKKKECKRKVCSYREYCPDVHLDAVEEVVREVVGEVVEEESEECTVLKKKYKKLKEKLKEKLYSLKKVIEYWTCTHCNELIKNEFHFFKACGHRVCTECINQSECPLCRTKGEILIVKLKIEKEADSD